MKRKILLVALLGAAVSLSLAETKTVHGKYTNKTGQRTDITGVSATTDLILDSTPNESANQGEMYQHGHYGRRKFGDGRHGGFGGFVEAKFHDARSHQFEQ